MARRLAIGSVQLSDRAPRIVAAGGEAELEALATAGGADLVELRADLCEEPRPETLPALLARLRAGGRPLILTARAAAEGGRPMDEARRRALYTSGLPHADAIDVEIASTALAAELVPQARAAGKTVVLSAHVLHSTPPAAALLGLIDRAEALAADVAPLRRHACAHGHARPSGAAEAETAAPRPRPTPPPAPGAAPSSRSARASPRAASPSRAASAAASGGGCAPARPERRPPRGPRLWRRHLPHFLDGASGLSGCRACARSETPPPQHVARLHHRVAHAARRLRVRAAQQRARVRRHGQRVVSAMTIPPEADMTAPDWYALVDGMVPVPFYANARWASTFGYTLEFAAGVEPTSFTPLASASGLAANPALSSADLASNFSATWDTTSLAPFPFP